MNKNLNPQDGLRHWSVALPFGAAIGFAGCAGMAHIVWLVPVCQFFTVLAIIAFVIATFSLLRRHRQLEEFKAATVTSRVRTARVADFPARNKTCRNIENVRNVPMTNTVYRSNYNELKNISYEEVRAQHR